MRPNILYLFCRKLVNFVRNKKRIYIGLLFLIFSNVSTKAIVEDKIDLKITPTELQPDSDNYEVILNQIHISEGHSRQKRANKRKNLNRNQCKC